MKPLKYRSKVTLKKVTIIDNKTAGMCSTTTGTTFVTFSIDNSEYDHYFIMEHKEFYNEYEEISE